MLAQFCQVVGVALKEILKSRGVNEFEKQYDTQQ